MRARWQTLQSKIQRLFRLIILFCVLRFVVGFAAIAIFSRDSVAWSWELTAIVIAMVAVYASVALAVRHWSPPHHPTTHP
jgi:steroid 5-alpha reductase family enzyme